MLHRPLRTYLLLPAVLLPLGLFVLLASAVPLLHAPGIPPGHFSFEDRHGVPLRNTLAESPGFQKIIPLEEISPHLVNATIAAEDKRFFRHPGIDAAAIVRSVGDALRAGRFRSGASTITQQTIKLRHPGPRTGLRKIRESMAALLLEATVGKEEILWEYLHRLHYGNLRMGPEAASEFYFGKPASDLAPAEAALLAAIPNAPTRWNPHGNFSGALARQQWILGRMLEEGFLSEDEYALALSSELSLRPPIADFHAPHFVDLLLHRRGVLDEHRFEDRSIATTIDLGLTRWIEQCLAEELERLGHLSVGAGAAVVIHNPTGEVLALAASGDFLHPGDGQINGAWTPRSPGSALKPFTYLLALEKGRHPGSIVADIPSVFSTPTGLYAPRNYHRRFHGPVSLRFALGNSLNVPAVRVLHELGGPAPLYQLLGLVGITTHGHPPDHYGLGLTLGNSEVRLLELTNAYATLARLGLHAPFRVLLRDSDSQASGRAFSRVFSKATAWLIADMLADNHARSAAFGSRSFLRLPFPVAAKTGTSSDYRDNWALGYTPEFTVGVWVGNHDNSPMREITGVSGAGPVFYRIWRHLAQSHSLSWYPRPEEIRAYTVHALTGKITSPDSPFARTEFSHISPEEGSLPDHDTLGRILLPAIYQDWLSSPENPLAEGVVTAGKVGDPAPSFLFPLPGTICHLDPNLPLASQRIRLRTSAPERSAQFTSPTLRIEEDRAELAPGTHQIHFVDPHNEILASTWIEVIEL